jgi:hypothetical protein
MYKKSSAAGKIAYFDTSTRVLIVLAAAATNTAEAANNRDLGSDSYRVSRLLKS